VASINLSFASNVVTYDAGIWDWFDMNVQDAVSGGTLMPLKTHVSPNPGPNYGLYYTTGWQTTAADLTPLAGQKIRLWFGNHQDGYGDQNAVYIDKITVACKVR